MPVFNYLATPVEVTPTSPNTWQDRDVGSYVPAGATGIIFRVENLSTTTSYSFGVRKNGSVDNKTRAVYRFMHFWGMIGIDSNRIFEGYVGSITSINLWLVGYTMDGVTFFTNAYDKSLSVTGEWTDINCSSEAPNAIGLIFEYVADPSWAALGMRKNGSTDNRTHNSFDHAWIIIGCDSSQICEGYIGGTQLDFFLVGYITLGATFFTNAYDKSLTSTGSYVDINISSEAPDSNGAIVEGVTTTDYQYALRKNGSSEDIYKDLGKHGWAIVEVDTSHILEGKIENTVVDFFLVGYSTSITNVNILDSIGLTDSILRDKTLSISDSIGLSDTPFRDWTPQITDVISLADQILSNKTFSITDSASLTDQILCDKTFTIADTISLSEIIQVITGAIVKEVLDSIGLTDSVLANKTLVLTETITLSDIAKSDKNLAISDVINILEKIIRDKQLLITDNVSLADIITRDKSLTITDLINLTDFILSHKQLLVSDLISLVEQVLSNKTLLITDSISSTDAVKLFASKIVTDLIQLTDIVKRDKSLVLLDAISL
ncbi:MAG: hypothetical protein H3Z53_05340, partial [archaeon]|nr:hypothetical protein [archaeon]